MSEGSKSSQGSSTVLVGRAGMQRELDEKHLDFSLSFAEEPNHKKLRDHSRFHIGLVSVVTKGSF